MAERMAMARAKQTPKESRSRGALEQEVLTCLAVAGRPLTAGEVQAQISGNPAYTTVMTTLARLHSKRALDRALAGRAYEYTLVGGTTGARSNMTAHQMVKLLDEESDRAGVLARFIAELSPDDEKLLTALLEQAAPTTAAPRTTAPMTTAPRNSAPRTTRGSAKRRAAT